MNEHYSQKDLVAARKILKAYGFIERMVVLSPRLLTDHPQEWYIDPTGEYEVQIDLTNRYPFNFKGPNDINFELEFSLGGLLNQLADITLKDEEEKS